ARSAVPKSKIRWLPRLRILTPHVPYSISYSRSAAKALKSIEHEEVLILVLRIGHRREVYRQ
ncbi:type II toxin-antitoxin system RelE/ParE family toxin, partial [Brachybacterium muris]